MKEIKFTFEKEEDYIYFINNVLNSFTADNGDIEQDETSVNIIVKNIKN